MKKIIAAFDGLKLSDSTLAYATMLGRQNNAHLVAVFLNDATYSNYSRYKVRVNADDTYRTIEELDADDAKIRNRSVEKFSVACRQAGLSYSVHTDKNIALPELLHESVFADLIIIDAHETFNMYNETPPTRFIRDFLPDVQCPVLLVPRCPVPIRKTVLLYDGKPSSVYAIRMFSYLLPALNSSSTEVITVKSEDSDLDLPDNMLMKEFMTQQYPNAEYTVLKGTPEVEIVRQLRREGAEAIVVTGAYKRNIVSRFFRSSMADVLARELKWPLFIAHQ